MAYVSRLFIGQNNKLCLSDSNLSGQDDYTVQLTVIDELGALVTDENDVNLENKTCLWDLSNKCYYFEITFHTDTNAGFVRVIWNVIDEDSRQVALQDKNSPLTIRLAKETSHDIEIVPVQWFLDDFLDKIDFGDYPIQNIRDRLKQAQADLEQFDVQTFFTPRTITDETHDYYYDRFSRTFWQMQMFHFPVIELTEMKLKYGDTDVTTIDNEFVLVEHEMGTIEILPSHAGHFYTLIAAGLAGLAHNTLAGWDRVPLFFHYTYKAGLDWENLADNDKWAIRNAIAKKAAIELLPKIDSRMGISSESNSVDGASQSVSYTSSAMYGQYSAQIEQYIKDLDVWVDRFRRRYGKNLAMSIA